MTYASFLGFFICIPIIFLSIFFIRNNDSDSRFFLKGIGVLCTLAFIWTTPWDNYLVANNVWGYGPDRVLAVIGYVPIEEYSFFFLQTIMTGLFTYLVQTKLRIKEIGSKASPAPIIGLLIVIWIAGLYFLTNDTSLYMGLILSWAMPICILQWVIGGRHILSNWKIYLITTLVPSTYLWLADFYAIYDNIWYISEEYILGFKLGVLPLEEATFFLVTNMMVTQGLILFSALRSKLPQYQKLIGMRVK